MRVGSVAFRKETKRTDCEWMEIREFRAIRKPRTGIDFSANKKRETEKQQESIDSRLFRLQQVFDSAEFVGLSVNDGLNRVLAELVFGYGVEKLAYRMAVNPKSLYRSFSLTEKRLLRVEAVDRLLKCFGLRLSVVPMKPAEQRVFESRRARRVASKLEKQLTTKIVRKPRKITGSADQAVRGESKIGDQLAFW